jgi:hypothetical protein
MWAAGWIAGLFAAAFADLVIGAMYTHTYAVENCDNGRDWQWACSGTVQDLLLVAFFAIPAAYIVAFVLAVMRSRRRERDAR